MQVIKSYRDILSLSYSPCKSQKGRNSPKYGTLSRTATAATLTQVFTSSQSLSAAPSHATNSIGLITDDYSAKEEAFKTNASMLRCVVKDPFSGERSFLNMFHAYKLYGITESLMKTF